MNPVQAILSGFRNYANFEGRACRSEYWWFYLFFVVLLIAIFVGSLVWTPALLSLWVAYMVVMAPALVSVTVRRLHDIDRSGRWAILGFLPFAGGPRLTRLLMQPGTTGPNRYGPDPCARTWAEAGPSALSAPPSQRPPKGPCRRHQRLRPRAAPPAAGSDGQTRSSAPTAEPRSDHRPAANVSRERQEGQTQRHCLNQDLQDSGISRMLANPAHPLIL